VYTVLGGASLGVAGGVLTHIIRDWQSATGTNAMVEASLPRVAIPDSVLTTEQELKDALPGKAVIEEGEEGVKSALKGEELPRKL
jgi:hypothetical protein